MSRKYKNCVIDLRMIEHSGIGVYIQSICNEILQNLKNAKFILLVDKKINYNKYFNLDAYQSVAIYSPIYSISEQIEIVYKLRVYQIDLYWSPHYVFPIFLNSKILLTVHDICHYIDSSFRGILKKLYSFILFNIIKFRLIDLIAVSLFTKTEIIKNFNISSNKIKIIYNGIDNIWMNTKSYKSNNIILYVGNNKRHKNIELLVDAYTKIEDRENYLLYLIGSFDFNLFNKKTTDIIKEDKSIKHISFISRNKLAEYYDNSRLFIFPSRYEGFGFPPLEAALSGCPILLSDIDVMKEIHGHSAFYFKSNNIDSLVEEINNVLNDSSLDMEKKLHDLENNAKKYNWNKCSSETIEIIQNHLSDDIH